MATKAKRSRVDVREQIIGQATKLFGERGFRGVPLRDIAKACGIPLSTLSSHFARKDVLQGAVSQRAVEVIVGRIVDARLAVGSPKQRFRQYLLNIIELFLSDLPEMKILDRELQELDNASTFNIAVNTSRVQKVMEAVKFAGDLIVATKSDIVKFIEPVRLVQLIFAALYGIAKFRSLHRPMVGKRAVSKAAFRRDSLALLERMLGN
jgi:AcrR family transcriptional regulator